MKLTVLVDNNTLIDKNYFGEPGLSFYVEDGKSRILFDTGYSDIFIKNAYKMGIDLKKLNTIVLSHGHLDHTWGLNHLLALLDYKKSPENRITLLAHPGAFCHKEENGEPIGIALPPEMLKRCFNVTPSKTPVWLSGKLVFLGEIERLHEFENRKPHGVTIDNGVESDDCLADDSALVYKSEEGLVIITGCSHSGICNIIDYACKVCGDNRIADIIGGFHMLNPVKKVLDATTAFFKERNPLRVHACHCTDLKSKIALSEYCNVVETGVGMKLHYK